MTNGTLDQVVETVVQDFINKGQLFTALDISNEVKKTEPNARHREVRDCVRTLFTTNIQAQGWDRAKINVQAEDGTTQIALLYHPLSDVWDLDSKYDAQQRAQASYRPVAVAQAVLDQAMANTPQPTNATAIQAQPTVSVSMSVNLPVTDARATWDQLFASQPSLFPVK